MLLNEHEQNPSPGSTVANQIPQSHKHKVLQSNHISFINTFFVDYTSIEMQRSIQPKGDVFEDNENVTTNNEHETDHEQ